MLPVIPQIPDAQESATEEGANHIAKMTTFPPSSAGATAAPLDDRDSLQERIAQLERIIVSKDAKLSKQDYTIAQLVQENGVLVQENKVLLQGINPFHYQDSEESI